MTAIALTPAERTALATVMGWRYDNVVETRQQTGDDEYNTVDENECSVLLFMLNDFDYDPATVASVDHLFDAIWVVLDDEHAYEDDDDLDIATLRSAATKIGYPEGNQP